MLPSRRQMLVGASLSPFCNSALAQAGPPIMYDQDGLIVHKGMDGGDTAQREGWYWLGVWIRQHVLAGPWPRTRRLSFSQVVELLIQDFKLGPTSIFKQGALTMVRVPAQNARGNRMVKVEVDYR